MKIKGDFVLRNIAGDCIAVPTGETAMQMNGLITMDETAAYLWELLQEEKTTEDLIDALLEEYEIDEDTVKKDVNEFLKQLDGAGILDK